MRPHYSHTVLISLLTITCSRPQPVAPPPVPDPVAVLPPVQVAPPAPSLEAILRGLTVREQIGQLIIPWIIGSYSAADGEGLAELREAVDSFAVGGIIVSVGSPLDVAAKLNALQRRSRLPLLIASDLEWGTGMRLLGGTAFPMPMALGATGRPDDAYAMGRITALEARAVGIHLTFSPVADVNSNPLNPIINTRSFGEDPDAVGRLLSAYIRGAEEHGLRTTAKHFPGHGDTGTDSHIAVPVVAGCWDRLDSLELRPFRAAIAAGVTAVMTAHVVMSCLDGPDPLPATLSSGVMRGILRDSLRFEGLVVTDALTMGAIIERFGPGETAVRAFEAGSDLLLMPADLRAAVDSMHAAVSSGRITRARLESSVRRVLSLKRDLGLFQRRIVPLDSVMSTVGRHAFQDVADDIARRALTLVQRGPIDSIRATRGGVALIAYAEETNLGFGTQLTRELRLLGDTVSMFRLYPASGTASYDSARAVIAASPRVLFASSVRPIAARGHVALPDSLAQLIVTTSRRRSSVLASLGSPYLLAQVPGYRGAYLIGWSANLATERAVARALAGGAPITGHLPITLGPETPAGSGIQIPE